MTTKGELLKTIRFQCQECMCMGSEVARKREFDQAAANLVEGCTVPDCLLYPFRQGKDPWKKRKGRSDWIKNPISSNPV